MAMNNLQTKIALQEDRSLQARGTVAVNAVNQDARHEGRNRMQHTVTGHRETQTI